MRDLLSIPIKRRDDMQQLWEMFNHRDGWVLYEKIESFLAKTAYSKIRSLESVSFEIAKQKNFISELMLAVECGWLQIENVELRFADKETFAFFAGVKLCELEFYRVLKTLKYTSTWRRIYPKYDPVALSMVGVSKNPEAMVENFANTDFIIAAKCINSGFHASSSCKRKITRELYSAMLSEHDSGRRPADCARELVQLDGVFAVPEIIETIRTAPLTTYVKTELSDYLAYCGEQAVPILLDALNEENEQFCHYYFIRAIRDIGDSQAIEPLVLYLKNQGQWLDKEIKMITVAALARLGDPQYVMLAEDMSFDSLW